MSIISLRDYDNLSASLYFHSKEKISYKNIINMPQELHIILFWGFLNLASHIFLNQIPTLLRARSISDGSL